MTESTDVVGCRRSPLVRPSRLVTGVGIAVAVACVGFASVNAVFEVTGRFSDGRYADYAAGLAVMDWLVVILKLLAAGIALLSVAPRQALVPVAVTAAAVWAAFGTLATYSLGGVAQAVGMLTGLAGDADRIHAASVAYLVGFLAAATGFGVLALSYSHRHRLGAAPAVVGVLAGPVVLAALLLVMPAALTAAGLFPGA